MNCEQELMLSAKRRFNLTYEDIAKKVKRSQVWVAALMCGQASATIEEVKLLADILEIDSEQLTNLINCPTKGSVTEQYKYDPVIYRLYEIVHVYGVPMKEIIHEKFGDGIMSAVDFEMDIAKEFRSNAERVKITMSGKFLPYKKW